MKLDITKKYKTRSGLKVAEIVPNENNEIYPFKALINNEDESIAWQSFTDEGFWFRDKRASPLDLLLDEPEIELVIGNLYQAKDNKDLVVKLIYERISPEYSGDYTLVTLGKNGDIFLFKKEDLMPHKYNYKKEVIRYIPILKDKSQCIDEYLNEESDYAYLSPENIPDCFEKLKVKITLETCD